MAQLEMFLGLKIGRHFPSAEPYDEPILPDDISDYEEEAADDGPAATGAKRAQLSVGAAAAAERAAALAFTAATRPPQHVNSGAFSALGTGTLSPPSDQSLI